jgi:non-heme chloroperoxidase
LIGGSCRRARGLALAILPGLLALLLIGVSAADASDRAAALRFVEGGGGLPIAVAQWGNPAAPAVLLIHGASFSKEFWLQQRTAALDACGHFVALDLRGHGASGKPWRKEDLQDSALWAADVDAAIASLGSRKVLLVGWSLGGFIAMDYVRHFGTHRLSGVLLIASPAGLLERTAVGSPPQGYATALKQRASLDLRENAAAAAFIAALTSSRPLSDEVRQSWIAQQLSVPVYLTNALRGRSLNNEDLIPRLGLPIEFLLGDQDASVAIAPVREFVERKLRHATVRIASTGGHAVTHDAPAAFRQSLDRLLAHSQAADAPRCSSPN